MMNSTKYTSSINTTMLLLARYQVNLCTNQKLEMITEKSGSHQELSMNPKQQVISKMKLLLSS